MSLTGQTSLALADEGAEVALAHGAHVEDAEAIAQRGSCERSHL